MISKANILKKIIFSLNKVIFLGSKSIPEILQPK